MDYQTYLRVSVGTGHSDLIEIEFSLMLNGFLLQNVVLTFSDQWLRLPLKSFCLWCETTLAPPHGSTKKTVNCLIRKISDESVESYFTAAYKGAHCVVMVSMKHGQSSRYIWVKVPWTAPIPQKVRRGWRNIRLESLHSPVVQAHFKGEWARK